MRYRVLLLLFTISCFFAGLQQVHASDIDILSKEDAAKLFTYSQRQWNENVKETVRTGIAKAVESKDGTLTLYTFRQGTILGVIPIYEADDRQAPTMLQVSTAFRPEHPVVALLKINPEIADGICQQTL